MTDAHPVHRTATHTEVAFVNRNGEGPVLVSIIDGVGQITLNRPERRNALSTQMIIDLAGALEDLTRRDDVAALLITGAGRAFCAGGDVHTFDEQGGEAAGSSVVDPAAIDQQQWAQRATVGAIYRSPKPVVAALPGAAAGAGIGLALAADLRIGCPRTVLSTAFAGVGLSGDFGAAWLLDRIIGPAKARELLYLSPRVGADECLELGLLNRLVPEEELASAALTLAMQLANGPSQALAGMKDNLLRAPRLDLEESMDAEVALHKATGTTAEHVNAVRAFIAKQRPEFSSHWRTEQS